MTKPIPPLARIAAKLYLGPPNRPGGFPISQGMLDAIEERRGSALYGETIEDVIGYMLRDAIVERDLVRRK